MKSNNYNIGLIGQNLVQKHLENLGFELILANFQFYLGRKSGEIDLIMQKNGRIHLIEVKTRTNFKFGKISEQITKTKLQTLARAWQFFIFKNSRFKTTFCQFDAAFIFIKNNLDISVINNSVDSPNFVANSAQNSIQNSLWEPKNNQEIQKILPNSLEAKNNSSQNSQTTNLQKDFLSQKNENFANKQDNFKGDFWIEMIWNAYQFD